MPMISKEVINDIQNKANIVDIIGGYVSLEKRGKNYFGLCPFHNDVNNPSFCVNEEKKIFTCFSCHKSGNVFGFIQERENVSFIEAVKIVGEKIGYDIDVKVNTTSKYERHYEAVELANRFYQNNLKSADGKEARKYLSERGIDEIIIDEFEIGFAPKSNDTVTKLLINKDFDENVLLEAGLSNRSNNLFDTFRNRVTFPIHNDRGRVVGFSARIYYKSDEAKYINTRETPIFKKGEILFNYHRAQGEARKNKYLLVVEGQMDAIRIYASGIKSVVATMGTALTSEHINLLKKLNVKIILCMDNDSAGEKATLANGDIISKANIDLGILRITGAKDPDEYLLKNSVEAFQDAINNSITFFDFKLNYLKKDKNLKKVDDVSTYINQVLRELNKSNDEILINLTINKLSEEYGIDKNILLNKIIKVETKTSTPPKRIVKKNIDRLSKYCEIIIYYMLNDIKYIKLYEQELSYLPNELYNEIANDILAFYIKYNYISIADFITYEIEGDRYDDVLRIIDSLITNELDDQEFITLINKVKVMINEKKIEELKEKLKSISDINEKLKITNEIANIKKGCVDR